MQKAFIKIEIEDDAGKRYIKEVPVHIGGQTTNYNTGQTKIYTEFGPVEFFKEDGFFIKPIGE